jgi:hypothetical protein
MPCPVVAVVDTRKTRAASRKSRRVSRRRRTMRGGASSYNSAGVGYGYTGTGAAGIADAAAYRFSYWWCTYERCGSPDSLIIPVCARTIASA